MVAQALAVATHMEEPGQRVGRSSGQGQLSAASAHTLFQQRTGVGEEQLVTHIELLAVQRPVLGHLCGVARGHLQSSMFVTHVASQH